MTSVPERHFPRVKWCEGYDMAEVNAFIERWRARVDGRPVGSRVTADEVRNVRFRSSMFRDGYDVEQIEALLGPAT